MTGGKGLPMTTVVHLSQDEKTVEIQCRAYSIVFVESGNWVQMTRISRFSGPSRSRKGVPRSVILSAEIRAKAVLTDHRQRKTRAKKKRPEAPQQLSLRF